MAANDKKKLEKRYITLGKHDDDLGEYEIIDGLTKKDSIAFPYRCPEGRGNYRRGRYYPDSW